MKIGNAVIGGKVQAVVEAGGRIIQLSAVKHLHEKYGNILTDHIVRNPELLHDIREYIDSGSSQDQLRDMKLRYAPVVMQPQKIICVGLNYRSHVVETKDRVPESPVLFSKYSNSLAASGDTIVIPHETRQLDYEGELGLVIGKKGTDIPEGNALDYVSGYFIGNDLSARDLQFRTSQWLLGKTGDSFYPCGPFMTTADEIRDPQKLSIRTKLNGEIRQDSDTSYMIFSCSYLISYISRFMTLYPGDIISTGTPEGVILGMPEDRRVWIRSGDRVSIEIEGLGMLENTFS
jgi:2-keto-4-pentenoate hydratase/2-oxohepta-3-ene-1,7-dioic acid hydratase in catechol pathway